MNGTNMKYPIGELAESASAAVLTADDQRSEKKQERNRSIIKLCAIGTLILIVIIFSSIAWFTMNTDVESGSMHIRTTELPFDIATKGASVRNADVINAKHSEYAEGVQAIYPDADDVNETYYTGTSLLLRYDAASDDPATADIDESITPDISPGSSGELSLYVIPKTDSAINVKVSLNVVAFAEIEKKVNGVTVTKKNEDDEDVPDTELIEITDASDFAAAANAAGNTEAADSAADYVSAAEYLKGHVLFFGGEGDTADTTAESARYYYTTPYTTRIINKTITAGNEGKAIQIPIYWMWTNTLGQIALPDNSSGKRSRYPVVSDNDTNGKSALINYLKTNAGSIFNNNSADTVSYITSVSSAGTLDESSFKTLSSGYNKADFEIGTKIAYFMIEINVES